jgi:phage anti-repressor protein
MDTDNILETLLCNEFTSEEQQLFVSNFKLYLQYGLDNREFVISADDVCEWLEFARKGNLKRLLEKHFIQDTDYTIEKPLLTNEKQNGGQNKEKIMMTVATFKAVCMLRDTEKGKKTRMYYTKMEEIFFNYMNIKHQNTIEKITKSAEEKIELERDDHLRIAYKERPCVYIAKLVNNDTNKTIIKLGESDNISKRISSLSNEYGEMRLLDVYPCICPHDFEQFLLKHHHIAPQRVKPQKELIELNVNLTIDKIKDIINKNITYFNEQKDKHIINILQMKQNESISQERLFVMQQLSSCQDDEMKQVWMQQLQILNETCKVNPNTSITETREIDITPLNLKRKVYKYTPDNLENPIAEFNSLKEAARSLNHKVQDYHIRQACVNNTLFADYRWYYVDNEDKPDKIPETTTIQPKTPKRNGLIAQLHKEKTKILNVFVNQKEASTQMHLAPCSITSALTKNKVCGGFYWVCYDECSQELKETFEGELPTNKQPSTCSKSVVQMKPDGEIVETFQCLQDVCVKYGTCHKTIQKYSETGNLYKGYKWRIE